MHPSSQGGGDDDLNPSTVEEIFANLRGRRIGFLRAFSEDVDRLYSSCNPEMLNVCLYGYPNGSWDVNVPPIHVPPKLPEPVIGINFARDGMRREDWLALVSVHSDCWLLSLASFYSARLSRDERYL